MLITIASMHSRQIGLISFTPHRKLKFGMWVEKGGYIYQSEVEFCQKVVLRSSSLPLWTFPSLSVMWTSAPVEAHAIGFQTNSSLFTNISLSHNTLNVHFHTVHYDLLVLHLPEVHLLELPIDELLWPVHWSPTCHLSQQGGNSEHCAPVSYTHLTLPTILLV